MSSSSPGPAGRHPDPRPRRTGPRLERRPAAFTPAPAQAVCPRCWSRLDVNWGKGRDVGTPEMRGWGVSRPERLSFGDAVRSVTVTVHRCANAACPTAVEVTTLLAGGYVPELVERRRLRDAEAARYAAGRHDAHGVWRDGGGEARTTPAQRELFG